VYDEIDSQTGIRISKYGAHLFHTNDEEVWNYVNRFGSWKRWEHRVIADCSGLYVPVPVTIETVNLLCGQSIQTEDEMRTWLRREQVQISGPPENSEQVALSRVGEKLYHILFKDYTWKQWAKTPAELEPSVLERIPVRASFDSRYFSDKFQALPENGYTAIVEKMLEHPNISVKLRTDWRDVKNESWNEIIFTGPIDLYFEESGLPPLEYRSIDFHWERFPEKGYAQPNSVVNYPTRETPYTRSVEYKHFLHQKSDWTVIARETTSDNGEPYYPVPTRRNAELYQKYRDLAEKVQKNVHFIGRLASYKYFNMDQAIRAAMDYYRDHFTCGKE
jgi:UDP-galactopyranose mutase